MEIIINELSITGQFSNKDDFLCDLEKLLPIIKLIKELRFTLLKEHSFFTSRITDIDTLQDILYSKDDSVRRMKSYLVELTNTPPFWNDSRVHNCDNDTYFYDTQNICNTSLAEASQRDKKILSFNHSSYQNINLTIQKNNTDIDIFNINDKTLFLDELHRDKNILPLDFCLFNFKSDNISFTKLEKKFGFNLLDSIQAKEFINSFKAFALMSWGDIEQSIGLEYKPYVGDWFNNSEHKGKTIKKFRVSEKYRCFGYRDINTFYVLRFEIDHKISDKG